MVAVGVGYIEPSRSKLLKNDLPSLNEFLAYTENANLNLVLNLHVAPKKVDINVYVNLFPGANNINSDDSL